MTEPAHPLVETTLVVVEIAERLREAARINKRLVERRPGPSPLRAAWPDVVRAAADAYGYSAAASRDAAPSAAEIDRMTAAIGWLLWIDEDERRLVWARALGVTWRQLERRDRRGLTERTLRSYWHAALEEIAFRLRTEKAA